MSFLSIFVLEIFSFSSFLNLFACDADLLEFISFIIESAVSFASNNICFASSFAFAINSFSLLITSVF